MIRNPADASWDFGAVTKAFADAAVDPSRWDDAMDLVAAETGSAGGVLFPVVDKLPVFPVSPRLQGLIDAYVRDGWIHRDIRRTGLSVALNRGVSTEFDFISHDEMKRHPYYQEFMRAHNMRWHAAVRIFGARSNWVLPLQRTIDQGPYSPQELERLIELSNLLSGAAALAEALGFARAEAALDAFELSGQAVVLLNARGEVFRFNRAAHAIFGKGLRIVRGRLTADTVDATATLDRALHALLWSPNDIALTQPVVLPRASGRPILAYPSRPVGVAKDVFAACQMIVVLVDLGARLHLAEDEARRIFGLTATEARLAHQLLSETSLEQAAERQGVTYQTVRATLKSVLRKTDTNRQGELIALLAKTAFRAERSEN